MRVLVLLLVFAYGHSCAAVAQPKRERQQGQANQQVAVSPSPAPSVQPTVEVRESQVARNETERSQNITIVDERSPWPVWIATTISALTLLFLAYQAYTSNQTLKAIETYEGVLQAQCTAMSELATATKDQLQVMREQYDVERDFRKAEIRNMADQTTAMEASYELTKQMVRQNAETVRTMQGQLAAMERQEKAMRDQAKIMGDSLVIGQRSYVGIADLGDFFTSRVVIKIENRGGVPAENVKLRLDALGGIKEDHTNQNARRSFRKPFSQDYGRAKLFRGSLPFTYSIVLEDFLSDQEIALLREGKGVFGLRGHIDYRDGFDATDHRRTEFSYLCLSGVWHAIAPDFWDTRVPQSGTTEGEEESGAKNPN